MVDHSNKGKIHLKYIRLKRKVLNHVPLVRAFLIAILLGALGLLVFGTVRFVRTSGFSGYLSMASNFINPTSYSLASNNNKTNILLMGKAGGQHDGPELTDTMMLLSVSLNERKVDIISIPRDLWIPEARAKINSAYYYGNLPLAKSLAEKVVGVPIQYAVVIDFSGFTKIIDVLGGVEVNVDKGFVDENYPIAGREKDLCGGDKLLRCRYETVTFNSGPQIMDGQTALKFVRSRHAEGDEGTDQAREKRQQEIIAAIKTKILKPEVFLNPKKDINILKVVEASLVSDMDSNTGAIILRKIYDSRNSIQDYLIPGDYLVNPPVSKTFDNQYVLIPTDGNGKWGKINAWVKSILE